MNIVVFQSITTDDFELNLRNFIKLIEVQDKNSFILASELTLNGYAYDRMDDAVDITNKAKEKLLSLSKDKTISLTMTTKKDATYYNTFFMFHNQKIIHTQSKNKLFVLNDERVYFRSGYEEDIKIFELDGLKIGVLICFELRFIDLWKKIQGADIILIPAMWGFKRKDNFETLTKALAVMNQCFVVASDSANGDMAKSSGIITPFGEEYRDDNQEILSKIIDLKDIKKFRRYMQVGIK